MAGDDLCKEHSGMTAVLERVETGVSKLWDKHDALDDKITDKYDALDDKITDNNTKVMEKLNEFEVHFATQEGARDRRKLDSIKSLGKNIFRAAGWILALGLTGGLSFATAYAAILKFWR